MMVNSMGQDRQVEASSSTGMMVSAMAAASPPRSYALVPPKLIGGALCLDFVNTLQWRGNRSAPGERLVRYEELLHWAAHAGALGTREGRRLLTEARRRPKEALAVLDSAIALREGLARLIAGRRGRSPADLELVEPHAGRRADPPDGRAGRRDEWLRVVDGRRCGCA